MRQWKEQLARLKVPLQQDAFGLDPEFQADLVLSNKIDWNFSVMLGRYGSKQVPIACSEAGSLSVEDSTGALTELLGQLTGTDNANSPLWETGTSLARWARENYDLLGVVSSSLISDWDEATLVEYYDSGETLPPLYVTAGGMSIADVMNGILTILTDVHDVGNNALRTKEAV